MPPAPSQALPPPCPLLPAVVGRCSDPQPAAERAHGGSPSFGHGLAHLPPPEPAVRRAANTFFKRSFSSASWPIFRSKAAMRASSVYAFPLPAKAFAPYFSCWLRHLHSITGCTWYSRAASARLLPASISRSTCSLNSLLNTLRLRPIPFYPFCNTLPYCLNFVSQ